MFGYTGDVCLPLEWCSLVHIYVCWLSGTLGFIGETEGHKPHTCVCIYLCIDIFYTHPNFGNHNCVGTERTTVFIDRKVSTVHIDIYIYIRRKEGLFSSDSSICDSQTVSTFSPFIYIYICIHVYTYTFILCIYVYVYTHIQLLYICIHIYFDFTSVYIYMYIGRNIYI